MNRKGGMPPVISGIKRAGNILINSNEFSSGINAFESKNCFDDYVFISFIKDKITFIHRKENNLIEMQV